MAETGRDIAKAAELLRSGEVVAIPTETVYGLAANALNPEACVRIFEIKERPFFDPLIVHIRGIEEVLRYAIEFPPEAKELCQRYWPGPLTVVLKKREIIPDIVTAGHDSVALRVPAHEVTLNLLQMLDFPLAAPSANPFGYVSPTRASHVEKQLGSKIPYILDGGPCRVGIESTIIRFGGERPELLRLGGMDTRILKETLGEFTESLHQGSNPGAPGQLDQHYAPLTRFILLKTGEQPFPIKGVKTALIRFRDYSTDFPEQDQYILSDTGDLHIAANQLFAVLRETDEKGYGQIIAETVPEVGIGRAINDRLRRAAAKGISPE